MASIFHTSTPLAASAATMFDFHSDPHNLPEVMPPTLTLVSLKTDGPAQEGRLIQLHCRDWWIIPMRWTCRWKTVQRPQLLVDEIVKGPFALFEHEHRFEDEGPGSCIMYDTVTYQWGRSWWGWLVSETGVRLYLTLLFKYRHHRTRKWAARSARTQTA
jgi:ligand-binding SRPBCC domain-containing protein